MSTILVADDNSNIQKMVGMALKDQGIDVIAVGNGEAAVRKLAESVPDLILADIFMPVRNGYEVCEYVKKDDRFAHVPVVLLVGAFDPLDEREVERVRADGVLKKPFVPPDPLIELVKSLLGKTGAASPGTAAAEDVESTQDVSGGIPAHVPTGTVRIPMPEPAPTERTQRLEPEPAPRMSSGTIEIPRPDFLPPSSPAAEAPRRSGTVEVPRPEVPPADRTQKLEPEGAPAAAENLENFKLGLAEPPPPPMEKTQQLTATDISKILSRESTLSVPPPAEAEEEEFAVPPSAVDFHGKESPIAFEDMLRPADEEETEEEAESGLGVDAFEAAEHHAEEEEEDEAEVRFGGIREEAKSPDPDLPPIPVDFGHSEPMEIITEEHTEASAHEIGPTEDLVSSASGWAASTAGGAQTGEPGLVSEGSEGFMTPPVPAGGIAGGIAATPAEAFEETTELPKHILQEEVERAQEIAARVAAQNREFLTHQEISGAAAAASLAGGPAIEHAINAADTILARHRAQAAAAEGPAVSPAPSAAAAPTPAVVPPPPAEDYAGTSKVARPASPEMIEAIAERVLAQLDPYIIEKISKEIVRPIVEAMIRKELEKFD